MKFTINTIITFLIMFSFLSCNEKPKAVSDSRFNDYALYDETGNFHRFSYYNNTKGIVLWVQGNGCPIVRNALTDFNEVVDDFSEDFEFFMINSNIQDTRETIAKEANEFNFKVPVLNDQNQLVADALNITLTAEAIVLHPTTREILYRGPINNRLDYESQKDQATERFLVTALETIIKGNSLATKIDVAKGCKVTRRSRIQKNDSLTYTKDIAPMLSSYCVRCHRDGGIAPWAMTDYNAIVGWSAMMKQVLLSKRMPPWKADPEIGEFKNSFALPDSNARKLIDWIDNGLVKGTGEDPLASLKLVPNDWENGIPDKVITLNKQVIPASQLIPYRYQKLDMELKEDVWLKGVEIKAGNPKVVHHIVLTNTETNTKNLISKRAMRPYTDNYIALAGGASQSTFFPEGTGVFIPKGTVLSMQIHYTSTGKKETDQTKVGFYFHEEVPEKEFRSLSPSKMDLKIPAFGENVVQQEVEEITRDIKVHYLVPHMHYRGKSIKMYAILPDGEKQVLISVPDYNFNWQWLYQLKEPFFVPKGSKIIVEGVFNNTYQNPLNPDPTKDLTFGIQSIDEMLIGFFNYTIED